MTLFLLTSLLVVTGFTAWLASLNPEAVRQSLRGSLARVAPVRLERGEIERRMGVSARRLEALRTPEFERAADPEEGEDATRPAVSRSAPAAPRRPSEPDPARAASPPFLDSEAAFLSRFQSDADCLDYLFGLQFPGEFSCPVCASAQYRREGSDSVVVCGNGHRHDLTQGTVLHGTVIPARLWFHAAWILGAERAESSPRDLRKRLGADSTEQTIAVCSRLRGRLAGLDGSPLEGQVEADAVEVAAHPGLLCAALLEVQRWSTPEGDVVEGASRLRLQLVPTNDPAELLDFVAHNIVGRAVVATPHHPRWAALCDLGLDHRPYVRDATPRLTSVLTELRATLAASSSTRSGGSGLETALATVARRFNRSGTRWLTFNRALGLPCARVEGGMAERPVEARASIRALRLAS